MVNGIVNFEIQLDNPTATYTAGETISGKLIIDLNRKKNLRALKLRFKGECQVHWTQSQSNSSNRKTHHYKGVENYFNNEICVFGNVDEGFIDMKPGHHVFPFSYNLPCNIPSSFEHHIGNVRYNIRAKFERPWKFDYKVWKFLTIDSPEEWDPSMHHEEVGIDEDIDRTFRNCLLPCINLGNISLKFRIPTTIFLCGDSIKATVNINNNTSYIDVVRIIIKLKQKLHFHEQRSSKKKHDIIEVQRAEKTGPFSKNAELTIGLQVPTLPCTFFKFCKLIDISYELHFEVHTSRCSLSTERTYDVVIGRKPLIVSQLLYSPQIAHLLVPSAPQLMLDKNSSPINPGKDKIMQYNFPSVNENSADTIPQVPVSFSFNNPPYPLMMFPGIDEFVYPPENTHQPPEIGFICTSSTSSHDNNQNEPSPPSYNFVMAEGQKNSYK